MMIFESSLLLVASSIHDGASCRAKLEERSSTHGANRFAGS